VSPAESTVRNNAVAAGHAAPLFGRQVKARANRFAAGAVLCAWDGQVAALESVAPMRVVLIRDAANPRQRRGDGRQACGGKGADVRAVAVQIRLRHLGVGGAVEVRGAAVAAVMALGAAETAGAATGCRWFGVVVVHCFLVEEDCGVCRAHFPFRRELKNPFLA